MGETDVSCETFVKGKKTSNLQNDGADGTSPYATEEFVKNNTSQIQIDDKMSDTSENAVQNKIIKEYVDNIADNKIDKVTMINPDFPDPYSIVQRTSTGQILATDPTADNDLVRLGYIKGKINHSQVYFGNTLPTTGIGTTYLENDVFVLNNSNGTKNFYQLKYATGSTTLTWIDQVDFEKPKWQNIKPSDTTQILETKITISACSGHTEFVGASKLVKGYVQDGADDWVINSLTNGGLIPTTFVGKIYKTYIQGVHLTPNQTIAYTNETGTDLVTFTYEYLW